MCTKRTSSVSPRALLSSALAWWHVRLNRLLCSCKANGTLMNEFGPMRVVVKMFIMVFDVTFHVKSQTWVKITRLPFEGAPSPPPPPDRPRSRRNSCPCMYYSYFSPGGANEFAGFFSAPAGAIFVYIIATERSISCCVGGALVLGQALDSSCQNLAWAYFARESRRILAEGIILLPW